jgi:hypothetical protein
LAVFSLWPSWVLTTRPGCCASGLIICQKQIQGYIQSWQLRPKERRTPAVISQFISVAMQPYHQIWPCCKSISVAAVKHQESAGSVQRGTTSTLVLCVSEAKWNLQFSESV